MPESTTDITISYENGDIGGSYKAGHPMVVFSHGFGVVRDSRGMFTDISNSLPPSWGYILFDYNHVKGTDVYLSSYSDQAKKLSAVLKFAAEKSDTVHLIGHSMGSITASLLASTVPSKVILLAPPVHLPRKSSNNSWAERPGAHYEGDVLIVPRKDGTTSHIPQSFFDEANNVDCVETMKRYSLIRSCTVVQAEGEDIISDLDRYSLLSTENIRLITIPGSHNFDPPHRQQLIDTVIDLLQ